MSLVMAAVGEGGDMSAKAAHKRYEGLVMVRSKAFKGKGAWYWRHLEPILLQNPETGSPRAVKLKCSLCNTMFSASNPSRTASEHLKRGSCPNFTASVPKPVPLNCSSSSPKPPRKRNNYSVLALPSSSSRPPVVLSGGKEDLEALALLEDNVKRIKSPNMNGGLGYQFLDRVQSDMAINLLAEWLYESCGSVSLSCVEHPKFKAFLQQVGLPSVSGKWIAGAKLDAKYLEVKQESEKKLKDAMFFQLVLDGWKRKPGSNGEALLNVTLNLPNGTGLFCKVIYVDLSCLSHDVVERTVEEVILSIDSCPEHCVGIVADLDKRTIKSLEDLELRYPWMINLTCQLQAFTSVLKDFSKHLPLFTSVLSNCFKVISFFTNKTAAAAFLERYQREHHGMVVPFTPLPADFVQFPYHLMLLNEVFQIASPLQSVVMDESFKLMFDEDGQGREVMDILVMENFWSDLNAVMSLVKIVREIIQAIEVDKPLVSQCLPFWNDLSNKVKQWCVDSEMDLRIMEGIISKRFQKNYHPAWSAALILDPLYLVKDNSGRYLPPYQCLSAEQEKDVDQLLTRLVSSEEAPVVLMELMKWRSEGLEPIYAQAIQVKEKDIATGRMKPMNLQSRKLVWESTEFKVLAKVAIRLIFLHASSSGLKCDWSLWRWASRYGNSSLALEKANKMIYIASNAKLERRDFTNDEEKDVELFQTGEEEPPSHESLISTL